MPHPDPEKIAYIDYLTPEGVRSVTVIDGQPFYRSTGVNSQFPGIWYPFTMCNPAKIKMSDSLEVIPDIIYAPYFRYFRKHVHAGVLLKSDYCAMQEKHVDIDVIALLKIMEAIAKGQDSARFGRRIDIITSMRLSVEPWVKIKEAIYNLLQLTEEENKLLEAPFQFEDEAESITKNPDTINRWLVVQGANTITSVVLDNQQAEFYVNLISPLTLRQAVNDSNSTLAFQDELQLFYVNIIDLTRQLMLRKPLPDDILNTVFPLLKLAGKLLKFSKTDFVQESEVKHELSQQNVRISNIIAELPVLDLDTPLMRDEERFKLVKLKLEIYFSSIKFEKLDPKHLIKVKMIFLSEFLPDHCETINELNLLGKDFSNLLKQHKAMLKEQAVDVEPTSLVEDSDVNPGKQHNIRGQT